MLGVPAFCDGVGGRGGLKPPPAKACDEKLRDISVKNTMCASQLGVPHVRCNLLIHVCASTYISKYPHRKAHTILRLGAVELLQRMDTDHPFTFRLPDPLSSLPGSALGLLPPPPPRQCELVCCAPPPLGEPAPGRGLANPIVDLYKQRFDKQGKCHFSTRFKRLSTAYSVSCFHGKKQKLFRCQKLRAAFPNCRSYVLVTP